MNNTKIDWATMTWNPVTGCLHKCPYCYARRIAQRFTPATTDNWDDCTQPGGALHEIRSKGSNGGPWKYGFAPTLHSYRLGEPARTRKPQTIFVGSMCDLFGEWVPDEWIETVFAACLSNMKHRYLFLTKNPERYLNLYYKDKLPAQPNFWYGTTITNQTDYERVWRKLANLPQTCNTFFSIEPMHGKINMGFMPPWIIIGAETGNRKDKRIPKREWVESIILSCVDEVVFMKESLRPIWGDNLIQKFPFRR